MSGPFEKYAGSRRPNPSLSDIARGPKTDGSPSDDWLVARAVEDVQKEVDALRGTNLCIQPIHNRLNAQLKVIEECQQRLDALESPHDRATGEPCTCPTFQSDPEKMCHHELADVKIAGLERLLADARRERDEALQQYAEVEEEFRTVSASQRHWRELAERFSAERDALQQQLAESHARIAELEARDDA